MIRENPYFGHKFEITEIYKPVTYMDGIFADLYEVSNQGNVRSLKAFPKYARRLMKKTPNGGGYEIVQLCDANCQPHVLYVHRLVAHEFHGSCPAGEEVNHINGNKADNRAVNLEYLTRKENIIHSIKIGLRKAGKIKKLKGR